MHAKIRSRRCFDLFLRPALEHCQLGSMTRLNAIKVFFGRKIGSRYSG